MAQPLDGRVEGGVLLGEADAQLRGGRGVSLVPQLPTLQTAKFTIYSTGIDIPDRFQEECGSTPAEVHDLLGKMMDVMVLAHDYCSQFTEEENSHRRKDVYTVYSAGMRAIFPSKAALASVCYTEEECAIESCAKSASGDSEK